MKRWRAAFLLALLSALPILFAWNRSSSLLEDSDTKGILAAIRAAHDPLRWFRGDWPIANHFYRPISSLVFEADNAIWHERAAGYGLTNALLCFGCVLMLFWTLRETTDRPWPTAAATAVFSLWHVGPIDRLASLAGTAAWATLLVGAIRHRRNWRRTVPAFLTLLALSSELLPIRPLASRMLDWIPGRTASTMTLFALAAIAAYARFERLRRLPSSPQKVTPETPPATRNSTETRPPGRAWPWAVMAVVLSALALGAYEQAVMLPAVLFVVALAFRLTGARPAWPLHLAFWGLLGVYAGLRWELLPHTVSSYQHQQYSSPRTAFWMEMEYVYPPLKEILGFGDAVGAGLLVLLVVDATGPWPGIFRTLLNASALTVGYLQARKEAVLALVGWAGSAVAYLPMAAFKLFEHYHYWPMAMRSAFVVAIGTVGLRLAATAWCPPTRPAPPRLHPAPGSLPRP